MVMESQWILLVFCLFCMMKVHCAQQKKEDSVLADEILQTFFFLADQPAHPESDFGEMPELHSMMLRPSVVKTFEEMEEMIPGSADIKYKVLDDLMESMQLFAFGLPHVNCSSEWQWLNLIHMSAMLMESKLKSEGFSSCIRPLPIPQNPSRFGIMLPENPCLSSSTTANPCPIPSTKKPKEPCDNSVTTQKPCPENGSSESEDDAVVGSVRGIPGVHYPDYTDIPITNFSCADKKVPGFYADLDTGCQVFHVCYEHRRESFLCPIGTIFNQPILACDYWYSSNCSLAPLYYHTITKEGLQEESVDIDVEELVSILVESETEVEKEVEKTENVTLEDIAPFLPVKAVITELKPEKKSVPVKPVSVEDDLLASEIFDNIISSATKLTSKTRDAIGSIPEPEERYKPDLLETFFGKSEIPLAKAKLTAVPASKGLAMKTAVPLAAKAKFAGAVPIMAAKVAKSKIAAAAPIAAKAKLATAAVPIAATKAKVAAALPAMITKAKFAAAVPVATKAKVAVPAAKMAFTKAKFAAAVPVATKAKVAIPAAKMAFTKGKLAAVSPLAAKAKVLPKVAVKAKMATGVPFAKAKLLPPIMKGKVIKGAGAPFLKAKALGIPLAKSKFAGSIPLAKVKLAKAAAISPLTKKALALGYMKLLKAKKLALMG